MSDTTDEQPASPADTGARRQWSTRQLIFVFGLVALLVITLAVSVVTVLIYNSDDHSDDNNGGGGNSTSPPTSQAAAAPAGTTPSQPAPTTQATTSPPPAVAVNPLRKGQVRLPSCSVSPEPRPGIQVTLTLNIEAAKAGTVGIGAGTYLKGGNGDDLGENDDTGDDPNHQLRDGSQSVTRVYNVPRNLDPGTYEISGELWETDEIGTDGKDITDYVCATMPVR